MFSISSVADEAPQLYHLTSDTASCFELSIFSHGLVSTKWEVKDLPNADRCYLNILVLVPEMLCDELHGLGGLVRLGGQEDVAARK